MALRSGFTGLIGPLYARYGAPADYTIAFRVEARHTNLLDNAHGGMLMSFADMAFGHCVARATGLQWVTVRLVCDFLSGARLGDWVEGAGRILFEEDRLYQVEGRIWCGERSLMAGGGAFKALEPKA